MKLPKIDIRKYFKDVNQSLNSSHGIALPLIILVVVVLLAGGGYFMMQKGYLPKNLLNKLTGQSEVLPPAKVDVRPGDQLPDALVTISAGSFEPQTIMVRKGQRVSFKNNDSKDHRIVPDSLASLPDLADTDVISPGQEVVIPFDKQGTFGIHDALDSKLKATVIVKF